MLILESNQALVISSNKQKSYIITYTNKRYNATKRSKIAALVAGDIVEYQIINTTQVVITKLCSRKNNIARNNKTVAANIDYLILVVAIYPKYQLELIDKYLIVAQKINIPIKIVVNKIDLVEDLAPIKKIFETYQKIGYQVDYISIKNNHGIKNIINTINNNITLLVGQSGVGKSSLINTLIPNINLVTSELSKTQLGKHTTTTTILHQNNNINIIDSPGVREFNLDNINKQELAVGFREFSAFAINCKFRNCSHINEPNCAVKQALKDGNINQNRYKNYHNIINTI